MQLKATITNGQIVYEEKRTARDVLERLEGRKILVDLKIERKTRTDLQNRAMHLYFTQLAEELNDAGFDMKKVIRVDVPWTAFSVKEYLWRPVQKMLFGKKSTTQLKTNQVGEIHDVVDRGVSERTGVHVPWPSLDNLMGNQT